MRCANRELYRKVAFTTWSPHLFPLRLLNRELWQSKRKFVRDGVRTSRRLSRRVVANNSEMHCIYNAVPSAAAGVKPSCSNRTSRQRQLAVEVMDDNYHEGDSVLSKINCADSDQCDPLAIVHYCARL
ncbi:hypothetical protein ALC56_06046 [Trachymyrmex septentrionalis]|uniref:Uncharacterized protein n=1 Tax=Trachymyrmex septentrionalis TaxID=34720 RepID=A0A195FGN4_9HYME|nr:hypothetical protein ALC56_06046 [Trachymyrmex septentrionalis]